MHRYCAGVSVNHFKLFEQSPLPFNCSLCVQRKQATTIEELKSTIAALTEEVTELRSALANVESNVTANVQRKWSDVVARSRPRRQKTNQSRIPIANNNSRAVNDGSAVDGRTRSGTNVVDHQKAVRVMVSGVRRVWGTRKEASPTVVLQTMKQLTKIDFAQESALIVKRKYQEGKSGRRDRWWFLTKSSETTLRQLEDLWSCVSLQVGWKLETCTKPSNDQEINTNDHVDANPTESNGESKKEVFNVSNNSTSPINGNSPVNSPVSTNASNSETAEVPCFNQPNDKQTEQTDHVDVNIPNINTPALVSKDSSFLEVITETTVP